MKERNTYSELRWQFIRHIKPSSDSVEIGETGHLLEFPEQERYTARKLSLLSLSLYTSTHEDTRYVFVSSYYRYTGSIIQFIYFMGKITISKTITTSFTYKQSELQHIIMLLYTNFEPCTLYTLKSRVCLTLWNLGCPLYVHRETFADNLILQH